MMVFLKLLLANMVILLCVWLSKRYPSLGGLIATMPLTSLIVLLWLQSDNPADARILPGYVEGVFFGVMPTLIFFGAIWLCLRMGLQLPVTLVVGFIFWGMAALVHQALLK